MKQKILTTTLLACLCGTAYANDCTLKLSSGMTVEDIGKITCQKSGKVVETKKEEKKATVNKKITVVKTYEVEKGQGIAQTLKKAHPSMSIKEANDEALKVAKDLNLTVTKTEKNEYFITVKPGFKFTKLSNGSYSKQ